MLTMVGTVIEAVGSNVETFAAGAVFYQVRTVLCTDSETYTLTPLGRLHGHDRAH